MTYALADATLTEPRELTDIERRWLKRLQRVLDAQPEGLTIYCHGDTATVLDAEVEAAQYDGSVSRGRRPRSSRTANARLDRGGLVAMLLLPCPRMRAPSSTSTRSRRDSCSGAQFETLREMVMTSEEAGIE